MEGLRARLGLQGNTSEEAEKDTGVAAGMVAPLLLLCQKRRQGWKSLCELQGLDLSLCVSLCVCMCVLQSREEDCICPVIEAPRPSTKAAFHGK